MKIYRVTNKKAIEEFFESLEIAEQCLALLAPGAAQHGGFVIEEIDVCPAAPCPNSEARREAEKTLHAVLEIEVEYPERLAEVAGKELGVWLRQAVMKRRYERKFEVSFIAESSDYAETVNCRVVSVTYRDVMPTSAQVAR